MKKMFKLFMCAAIVAAGFTACSEEVTPIDDPTNPDNPGPVAEAQPTYATFSFGVQDDAPGTKALQTQTENTGITDYRVMIFDATGKLEVDTTRQLGSSAPAVSADTLLSIVLMSGSKRIYVYANGGFTAGPTSPEYIGVPAKGDGTFNYVTGTTSMINQSYWLGGMTTATPPLPNDGVVQTDLPRMHPLYASGKFFYSNRVSDNTYNLLPNVTLSQSQTDGNNNRLYIHIDRAVAKMGVRQTASADNNTNATTMDEKGEIKAGTIKYKVWNVNTRMHPFQNYDGTGTLITPDYIPSTTNTQANLHYAREQGVRTDETHLNEYITIPYGTAIPSSGYFYYVSENNPSTKMKGNTTYANVEAVYLPKASHYVTGLDYNETPPGSWTTHAGNATLTTATDMYLLLTPGNVGLPVKTLFAGDNALNLALKVYYHIKNPATAEKALTWYTAANVIPFVQTEFDALFSKYIDGKAYYRLNIGNPTGSTIDYIVRRNYHYDCNITGFRELGANTPKALNEPEDEVLAGITNLSVTIKIRPWGETTINAEI
jgi:hypothetical protein